MSAALSLWDTGAFTFDAGSLREANDLLRRRHYLGPANRAVLVVVGRTGRETVAAQVWALPTSRRLPLDGSWLELTRWCLTPEAGTNAGSRMHAYAVRLIRDRLPKVTTLVSYSDPSAGHTGSLYKACNWRWRPTWHRLRPPPTGLGTWDGITQQEVKDRWVYPVRRDKSREDWVRITDQGALRLATPEQLAMLGVAA